MDTIVAAQSVQERKRKKEQEEEEWKRKQQEEEQVRLDPVSGCATRERSRTGRMHLLTPAFWPDPQEWQRKKAEEERKRKEEEDEAREPPAACSPSSHRAALPRVVLAFRTPLTRILARIHRTAAAEEGRGRAPRC